MKESKKAVMYRMVSEQEQKLCGFTLKDQEEQIREYASKHNIDIVGSYIDIIGNEKTVFKESSLAEAIRIAGLKRCAFICARLDRIARTVLDGLMVVDELNKWHSDFIAVDSPDLNKFVLVLKLALIEHACECK